MVHTITSNWERNKFSPRICEQSKSDETVTTVTHWPRSTLLHQPFAVVVDGDFDLISFSWNHYARSPAAISRVHTIAKFSYTRTLPKTNNFPISPRFSFQFYLTWLARRAIRRTKSWARARFVATSSAAKTAGRRRRTTGRDFSFSSAQKNSLRWLRRPYNNP